MVYNGHREMSLVVAGRKAPRKSLVLAGRPTMMATDADGGTAGASAAVAAVSDDSYVKIPPKCYV